MNFDLSDEQKMLAEQTAGMLAKSSPPDRLRKLIDQDAAYDEPLWKSLAEMGYLGAAIDEAHGGLGLGDIDLGIISQEIGRSNAALPFFSSIVLAAAAIQLAGTDAQKARYLPGLAAGETIGCFAYAEGPGGWALENIAAVLENGTVSGCKSPVADAGIAQIAVVLVRHDASLRLAVVDLAKPGVTRTRLASFDQLRHHYTLDFTKAEAELLDGPDAALALDVIFDKAAVQAGFEAVGGAQACLDMACAYAMERQIFGRKLGGYQAIKHRLADVVTGIELARASAYYAGWAALDSPAELPEAAACLRLNATAAFERAARENLQIHGGIGFTFEANCHFYYRRERTLALSLGNREHWADRLLAKLPAMTGKAA